MPRQDALVTGALLRWARQRAGFDVEVAADKVHVSADRLRSWEEETGRPTLRQAKDLARIYRQPFALFYLSEEPDQPLHLPRDYRRHAGTLAAGVSSAIRLDVERAWERRAIALELAATQRTVIPNLEVSISITDSPEAAGAALRAALRVSMDVQATWRDVRVAFNQWRAHAEAAGILVLQTSGIDAAELRAYSLFAQPLPVIVLNRKDVYPGRTFSLVHEVAHLALRSEGLCDLTTRVERPPELQRLEVFCNAVAAACLMPSGEILQHPLVRTHDRGTSDWDDRDIVRLARHFSVSREAVLRRLMTHGLTTAAVYERKRAQYQEEYEAAAPSKGYVSPPTDAVSQLGRTFVRLVLDSFDSGDITATDVSDYLGVRLKHLPAVAAAVETE
jgi:Zn-dependent peptidase ImmA (M78 family)